MSDMIEKFVIEGHIISPPVHRTLDFEAIVALSDADFAKLYLELMNGYRDKDGWWKEGKIPYCHECHLVIPEPAQLRRYYGSVMHPDCFKRFYERNGDETGVMRQYWERVARLVLDSNSSLS